MLRTGIFLGAVLTTTTASEYVLLRNDTPLVIVLFPPIDLQLVLVVELNPYVYYEVHDEFSNAG